MNGSTLRKLIAWIKDGDNAYFNAGDIAIGHNSPTAKLHVKGAGATSDTSALKVENSAGSILLNILNNGKIGVNKLAPVYDMDIVGDLNFTGSLLKNGAAYNPGSQWQNNGSNIYFNSGNVGIGTTNPQTKLHIYGSSDATYGLFEFESSDARNTKGPFFSFKDASGPLGWIGYYSAYNSGKDFVIKNYVTDGGIRFNAGNSATASMMIDSTGNVGIGTTTPGSYKLFVNGTAKFTGAVTAASFSGPYSGTIGAANVSNGAFGSNTGGGVYTFPGNVGIGITTPTAKLDINSDILRLRTAKTPATAGASGNAGDICWDSSYFYICVATNTWKRSAIATW